MRLVLAYVHSPRVLVEGHGLRVKMHERIIQYKTFPVLLWFIADFRIPYLLCFNS